MPDGALLRGFDLVPVQLLQLAPLAGCGTHLHTAQQYSPAQQATCLVNEQHAYSVISILDDCKTLTLFSNLYIRDESRAECSHQRIRFGLGRLVQRGCCVIIFVMIMYCQLVAPWQVLCDPLRQLASTVIAASPALSVSVAESGTVTYIAWYSSLNSCFELKAVATGKTVRCWCTPL